MGKGIALTIGLNAVDQAQFSGWDGKLVGCEADARALANIARAQRFSTQRLLTARATRRATLGGIARAAKHLKSGDIFMLTYAGCGGTVPDRSGEALDGQVGTWCLYDGQLLYYELYTALGSFAKGVRVLVISDACHSGTVIRFQVTGTFTPTQPKRYRLMPPDVALRTYRAHRVMYDRLQKGVKAHAEDAVRASVILLSGCQGNQLTQDGDSNGLFIAALVQAWNRGRFTGSYRRLHRAIARQMPADQTPNFSTVGARSVAFERQRPFTV